MTVKRDSKALQRIISRLNNQWQDEAKDAVSRLYELIEQGNSVDKAVSRLAVEYPNLFTLSNLLDALVEAAAYGYGIVPEMLDESTVNDWRTKLADSWDASGMKLSEKLHGASQKMRNNIIDTLREQMRKNKSWTEAARALYDGYSAEGDVVRKQDIPKYLKTVLNATRGDKKAVRAEQKALNNIQRMAKKGAPNKALKTAYKELLERAQNGTEKQVQRACKVAMEEKARYVAERIARTEAARAWADGFWAQIQADDDVVAVQFKLATRHPFFDICDMFAKADMFGLGAGVFPKNKIPPIPVHPHCLCRYTELYDGEVDMAKQKEQVKQAGDKWLKSLPEAQRMQVLGVKGTASWEDGKSWQSIIHGWAGLREAETRIQTGATNGALNNKNDPTGERRNAHAERFYEARRKNGRDAFVNKINQNTGISKARLRSIYNHVFINEYDLDDGHHSFYPDYCMAESFRRLMYAPKEIKSMDIIMLKHEHLEFAIMHKLGYNYNKAHKLAERHYNYSILAREYMQQL